MRARNRAKVFMHKYIHTRQQFVVVVNWEGGSISGDTYQTERRAKGEVAYRRTQGGDQEIATGKGAYGSAQGGAKCIA